MQKDWHIHSPSHQCCVTGQSFSEGETFFSILEKSRSEWLRKDFSKDAWSARNDNLKPVCFWKSEFKIAPPPPPEPLQKDQAETLLRHLMGEGETVSIGAKYVLAAMLERKRLFRQVEKLDQDGRTVLVYEHLKTGETFLITDPGLKLAELDAVQKEVMLLLAGGQEPT